MVLLTALLLTGAALPAQTGGNVLLVVNQPSEQSRQAGEYYARRRAVPARNIRRVRATSEEEISRDICERQIDGPVSECLKSRKLREQVIYIVTTPGVPPKIAGSPGGRANGAASVEPGLTLLPGV